MSRQWHLLKDGQTYGPYSEEQMKPFVQEGRILPADLVWSAGMEQWLPAGQTSFFAAKGGETSSSGSISAQPPQPELSPPPAQPTPTVQGAQPAAALRQPSATPRPRGGAATGLKILGLILTSIILVITGWVYQAGMGMERTVFNTDYYRSLFQDVGLPPFLYQGLQELGIPSAAGARGSTGTTREDVTPGEAALMEAFSEEWMQEQFLIVIDDILAVLDGEQESLTGAIDLREVKERLRHAPDAELQAFAADWPDQLLLQDVIGTETGAWNQFQKAIFPLQQARRIFRFAPYIVFAFLFLFCLLMAGFAGALKWFGAAALVSGIPFWMILQAGGSLIAALFPPEITNEMQPVLRHIVTSISAVSLVYAGAGLALLVVGIMWR